MNSPKRVLILGVSGMLGSAIFRILSKDTHLHVEGTCRQLEILKYFSNEERVRIHANVDVLNNDDLVALFSKSKPNIVINCVGIIKQHGSAKNPLEVLPINSLLPYRLSNLCNLSNARLILISTDCVFNGRKGNYTESDLPNAEDLYGKSKEIGEITDQTNVLTIRTSIIGHELNSNYSLVNWFLSQNHEVKGFTKAIFSGLPTCEIAEIIGKLILPNDALHGLYHISSNPISKFDLLKLIAEIYGKKINIIPSDELIIDRSLDSSKFREETSYSPRSWGDLIFMMKAYKQKYLDTINV
ncbi:dTDP-4-dehydrorhamnose reductase family protein [Leptospira stimsonii]|uniref:dTDP-4-dehydrorhamnose reductase n=1 Tax=Leptospira stimsonii TaxID=2202203 RepID=A0A396ZAW5_9LEPT|nr:SDR family oxidoreductase [Leptospira stimsonii]RHX90857.1 NAD(P)-dependent oxidoreductase [Leptospira stimsonii]